MTKRLMGKFSAGLALVLMTGCQDLALTSSGSKGSVRFRFEMPKAGFALQAIPAGTNRFEIEISGEGLTAPRKEMVTQADSNTKIITELPVGSKQVVVKALKDTELLANGTSSVTIAAGQTASAEVTLAEVLRVRPVSIKLEEPLPMDLVFKTRITGQGLSTTFEKEVTIAAEKTEASLGDLPLGAKEIQFTLTAVAGSKQVSVTPEPRNITVSESGATLDISAGSVISGFGNDLESLLSSADSLKVLTWIQTLRARPARLRELFFMLPPAARQRLRQNPLVSSFLPEESEASATTTRRVTVSR